MQTQGKYKYSFGTLWSKARPFLSSFLCFTRNGGFDRGTEFPGDQETDVSG